jgi:hypothetical protein
MRHQRADWSHEMQRTSIVRNLSRGKKVLVACVERGIRSNLLLSDRDSVDLRQESTRRAYAQFVAGDIPA